MKHILSLLCSLALLASLADLAAAAEAPVPADIDPIVYERILSTGQYADPNMDYRTTDEYLQADLLDETHNGFVMEYWGRNDVSHPSWHDNVMAFEVKATNTPDDESSWTTITTLDKSFPAEGLNAHYVSPRITASQNYRYWRFYVRKQGTGQAYWNMSEFQLYDKLSPSEGSLYTTNADAKAAGDAIQAALTKAENDIANSTIDGTEAQGQQQGEGQELFEVHVWNCFSILVYQR